jgi:hypothetical protein
MKDTMDNTVAIHVTVSKNHYLVPALGTFWAVKNRKAHDDVVEFDFVVDELRDWPDANGPTGHRDAAAEGAADFFRLLTDVTKTDPNCDEAYRMLRDHPESFGDEG